MTATVMRVTFSGGRSGEKRAEPDGRRPAFVAASAAPTPTTWPTAPVPGHWEVEPAAPHAQVIRRQVERMLFSFYAPTALPRLASDTGRG